MAIIRGDKLLQFIESSSKTAQFLLLKMELRKYQCQLSQLGEAELAVCVMASTLNLQRQLDKNGKL